MSINRDDEISTVLRHFQPRPMFIPSSSDHEWTPGLKQQRQKKHRRGYSSVKYLAADDEFITDTDKLRLTYLHTCEQSEPRTSCVVFLAFEVPLDSVSRRPLSVKCVLSAPDEFVSERMQLRLNELCKDLLPLRPSSTTNAGKSLKCPSLFSVVSRLLQLLNDDLPSWTFGGSAKVPETEETLYELMMRFAAVHSIKSLATIRRMLDVQALLLRCAAAGRNRSKLCAPVPVEFAAMAGGDGDALARHVFAASDSIYAYGLLQRRAPQQTQCGSEERQLACTLLAFLLSLPWSESSCLVKETSTSGDSKGRASNDDGKRCSRKRARICLDIGSALGDETSQFATCARKYGTVKAYHGTKIENAWSILNHGLRNLSYDDSLSQNGAMMGDGVYLSTSRGVAEMFAQTAAERPSPALALAFQHESLLSLLCHCNVDVASLDPLDEYTITCLPVFEATIIAPPDSEASSKKDASIDKSNCTRQEGKYFCTNSELVRITKLHLTLELSKKSTAWCPHPPLYLIILLVAILWAMMEQ